MCLSEGHPEAMKASGAGRMATPPLSDGSATWDTAPGLAHVVLTMELCGTLTSLTAVA